MGWALALTVWGGVGTSSEVLTDLGGGAQHVLTGVGGGVDGVLTEVGVHWF